MHDISSSVLGRRWKLKASDEHLGLFLAQRVNIPEPIARLLTTRGISDIAQCRDFLNPTLKSSLPDPFIFKDMERAVLRIEHAILNHEPIVLFGDYDVDGATSTALFQRFFNAIRASATFYIPDRIKEGYGPNIGAFEDLHQKGARLILILDSGTVAFDALDYAHGKGLDVIVIDHHISEIKLPKAYALVNPNRIDETPSNTQNYGNLSAVGVCFLVLVALNRHLRTQKFYEKNLIPEPDLRLFLDLVALGTVCDVVPLTGLNRTFVAQGLKIMANRTNLGLSILADIANLDERPESYHAGFVLGPRINAGGRVGRSDLGAHLLSTQDPSIAKMLAQNLHLLNQDRQKLEQTILDEAISTVEALLINKSLPPALVIMGEGWHPGIIGIIAGRLKDRYGRPTCVIGLQDGIGKASARSVAGVNLGNLIHQAKNLGLLTEGGGHSMAAGFTIEQTKILEFQDFLNTKVSKIFEEIDYTPTLDLDGYISVKALTPDFLKMLETLSPFGMGNPTPRFILPHVQIIDTKLIQNTHIRCILRGEEGSRLEAISFRSLNSPLGEALLKTKGCPLHLAGTFHLNRWKTRETVQMTIEDAAFIEPLT